MAWWKRAYRRRVYGPPIIIVSGLPRSGTSMMMRMLQAGGMPLWHDGIRSADDLNPHGYYELERVKDLDKTLDKGWVREGRGRAVKVISPLLEHLPRTNNYKVIFMRRDLREVLASQARMLAQRGETDHLADDVLRLHYESHLRTVKHLLSHDSAFSAFDVGYRDVLNDPQEAAHRVDRFIGRDLDVVRMAAAVDISRFQGRGATS